VAVDVCRVVLIAPHRTLEVALPQGVPLADLIPVLVQRVTLPSVPDRPGRGRGRALTGDGDWVLQRLGGAPLEEELTPAALQIRDGETLYLRPRDAQLPPAHFDDLIDGLATGIRNRRDRWRDSMTRALFLIVCALILGICFVLLLDKGFVGRERVAGAVAVVLMIGAMIYSRALADTWAGLTLGVAALPFAALTGFQVPPRSSGAWLPASLLCAAVAASVVAMVAVFVIGEHRALFLGVWLTGMAASTGTLMAVLGLSPPQAAGAVVTTALIASVFAPGISFRLARLRLPQLPTGSADLADDIEPYPAPELMAGAVAADTYLTWICASVGVVCAAGTVVVARAHGWDATTWIGAVSLVLMVRSRGLTSGWQRAATLAPALLGPAALAVEVGNRADPLLRMAAMPGLLLAVGIMLACSRALPGRRLLPYWGRIVDAFEYVFAIAMVALLLELFGVYGWARAMAG
jgi:type VII secretion integral membrane protein EccD